MLMTVTDQRRVAQGANWYFDVYFGQNTGDSVVFSGDGVDDLDRLIATVAAGTNRGGKMVCDVGVNYSSYRPCDLEDVQAIRTLFIGWYGTVAKPDAYAPRR
jgi:hypothetical protein